MKLTPQLWTWAALRPDDRWLAGCPAEAPMVWQAGLTDDPGTLSYLASLMSTEEHARLERLQVREDRQRFLTGRGLLRLLAGVHLSLPAERVEIIYGPFGKPLLALHADGLNLHFNVSHSGNLVLLAFHPVHEVGVDLEQVREQHDWEAVARRIFSAENYRRLARLNPEERLPAFFQAWTRHEARLKAKGLGFSNESHLAPYDRWACFDLALPEGYQGAVGCLRSDV